MKSIKNQYIDLKEGKISEAQFMRNVRMTLPEYISNVTLFKQAERILINKGIISEVKAESPLTINGKVVNTYTQNSDESYNVKYDDKGGSETIMKKNKGWDDINTLHKNATNLDEVNVTSKQIQDKYNEMFGKNPQTTFTDVAKALGISEPEIAAALFMSPFNENNSLNEINVDGLKQMGYSDSDIEDFMDEWKQGGSKLPEKVRDYLDGLYNTKLGQLKTKSLREAKDTSLTGYYNQDGKEQYSKFNELDNMNAQEIMAGYVMEKQDNPNIDQKEAVKLVIKNLKSDQFYYTNYKLTGIRGLQPTEFTSTKRKPFFDEMEEVNKNGDNFVDEKNKMVVIKESQYTYKYKIGDSFTVKNLQKNPDPAYKDVKVGDEIKITKVWSNLAGPVYGTNISDKTGLNEKDIAEMTSNNTLKENNTKLSAANVQKIIKNAGGGRADVFNVEDQKDGNVYVRSEVSGIYRLVGDALRTLESHFNVEERYEDHGDREEYEYFISDKMNEVMKPDSKLKLKELVRKMMKEIFDGRDNLTDINEMEEKPTKLTTKQLNRNTVDYLRKNADVIAKSIVPPGVPYVIKPTKYNDGINIMVKDLRSISSSEADAKNPLTINGKAVKTPDYENFMLINITVTQSTGFKYGNDLFSSNSNTNDITGENV